MSIRNRKVLTRISFKSFLASGKQNLIAVSAIILTSVMFTSLFTVFFSLDRTFKLQELKQCGFRSDAMVCGLTEEKRQDIVNDGFVSESGEALQIGYSEISPREDICYFDEASAGYCFVTPYEGKMPEKKDEIVIGTGTLDTLGVEKKIGSKVEIEYYTSGTSGEMITVKDTFTVSGLIRGCSPYLAVSKEYADDIIGRYDLNRENVTTTHIVFLKGLVADSDSLTAFFAEKGVKEDNFYPNPLKYDPYMTPGIGPEGVVAIVIFVILIIVTGFLIIYNIFQITVAGKIRSYGLLKTVGVTSKQLRRIVFGEAFILCAVSIPIGIALGCLIGNSLIPAIMKITTYGENIEIVSGTNILVLLGSALFSVLTVFLSCFIPAFKASGVSPVEAVRYSDAKVSSRPHKGNRAKIPAMAFSNLGRNKKRTFMVLLSLSLALVVFNTLFAFLSNIDMNEYLHSISSEMDFVVSTPDYFQGDADANSLSDIEIEKIASNIDTSVSGRTYLPSKAAVYLKKDVDEPSIVIGMDDPLFSKLKASEGNIDDIFKTENGLIMEFNGKSKVGDKVTINYVSRYGMQNKNTGEILFFDTDPIPDDVTDYEMYIEWIETEFTVCAIVKEIPSDFSANFIYAGDGYSMLVRKEGIEDITGGEFKNLAFLADADSDSSAAETEKYLKDLTKDSERIQYKSIETEREEFRKLNDMILKIGIVIVVTIGIIGILNFINAILTSILSRKHELAMLAAVGMTRSQIRKMLFIEGAFYSVLSVIIAVPLSLLMNALIGSIGLFWLSVTTRYVLWPLLLILPVFGILSYLIPNLIYGHIRSKSIVDDLKVTE